jgi:hypothetical protein
MSWCLPLPAHWKPALWLMVSARWSPFNPSRARCLSYRTDQCHSVETDQPASFPLSHRFVDSARGNSPARCWPSAPRGGTVFAKHGSPYQTSTRGICHCQIPSETCAESKPYQPELDERSIALPIAT